MHTYTCTHTPYRHYILRVHTFYDVRCRAKTVFHHELMGRGRKDKTNPVCQQQQVIMSHQQVTTYYTSSPVNHHTFCTHHHEPRACGHVIHPCATNPTTSVQLNHTVCPQLGMVGREIAHPTGLLLDVARFELQSVLVLAVFKKLHLFDNVLPLLQRLDGMR